MRESLNRYPCCSAVYSLQFSVSDPQIDALRIVLHDARGAHWNGLGPRETHTVRGRIALSPGEEATAFTLDGRFMRCVSEGTKTLSFHDAQIVIEVELPAALELGYADDPEEACGLWYLRREGRLCARDMADERAVRHVRHAAGLLGSLSFSGAEPAAYQRLNREFARETDGELVWKIADMLLCQPDIVLPREYRRELPQGSASEGRSPRAQNRYAKVRSSLAQYWDSCERRWNERGIPALVHPSMLSGCGRAFDDRDDILFSGPDLIFAPNLTRGGDVAELALPEGEWVHLWTSRLYHGGKTTVHAPKGNPALFYRSESEFAWLFDSIRQIASRL